jgi:hypothetical protein
VEEAQHPILMTSTELPLELPIAVARRNADFHSIFPSLQEELLIEDFSCAILRDILIQGRLYLSENHLAFSARLLTWTFDVVIALNSIISIDKRFVAGFIPNAIEISTQEKKYFFASFLQRDYAYDVLRKAWNGPPSSLVESQLEASFLNSTLQRMKSFGDSLGRKRVDSSDHVQPIHHPLESDMNELTDTVFPPSSTPCPMASGHFGTQLIVDEVITISPDKIWSLLFSDEAIQEPTGWLQSYHTLRQRSDFKFSHWPFNDAPYPHVGSIRSFSYVVPVNGGVFYQGKTTPCFGSECILDMVVDGEKLKSFCVLTEAKTPQVPYGDTFLTKTHVCIFPFEQHWKMRVSVQADFKKPPWTRSKFTELIFSHY